MSRIPEYNPEAKLNMDDQVAKDVIKLLLEMHKDDLPAVIASLEVATARVLSSMFYPENMKETIKLHLRHMVEGMVSFYALDEVQDAYETEHKGTEN